jgi:hypothetical protein
MRPLRDIRRLVRHAQVHSKPGVNRVVLDDLRRELDASRTGASIPAGQHLWRRVTRSPLASVAAVAALILVVALVMVSRGPEEPARPPLRVGETLSAADMLTVCALNAACRRGGLPEIERQCERAARKLDLRPERVSVEQLTKEMNGT